MAGLDCPRKLWQLLWDRESAAPFGGMSQLIMEMGTRFGILAHQLYPGATLIDVDIRNLEQSRVDTEAAIAAGANTVLEACFVHDHFRVLSDIVDRLPDGTDESIYPAIATIQTAYWWKIQILINFLITATGYEIKLL